MLLIKLYPNKKKEQYLPYMNLNIIIILSSIFSSSSSVASLLPARSFESTYLAKKCWGIKSLEYT